MSTDNYENHLCALEEFRSNLKTLQRHTITMREQYAKQLLAMESAGFVQNITHPLQERYQLFSSKMDNINQLIDLQNNQLNLHKEALEQLAQMARMNP